MGKRAEATSSATIYLMGRGQQTVVDRFSTVFGGKRGHKDHDLERYVVDVSAEAWGVANVVMDCLFGRHYSRPEIGREQIQVEAEYDFKRELKEKVSLSSKARSALAKKAVLGAFSRDLAHKVSSGSPVAVKKIVGTHGYSRWMSYQRELASEQDVRAGALTPRVAQMVTEGTIGKVLDEVQAMRLVEKLPVNHTDVEYLRWVATETGLKEAKV